MASQILDDESVIAKHLQLANMHPQDWFKAFRVREFALDAAIKTTLKGPAPDVAGAAESKGGE